MIIGFSVSMFLLRTMGIIYRNNWIIIDNHDEFIITYKNKLWKLDKKDICKINYLGNEAFQYLSFFQKVKIRVGMSFLTPFSKKMIYNLLKTL